MDRLVTSNNGTPDVWCGGDQKGALAKTSLDKGSVLTQWWIFKSDRLVMHTYFSVPPKVKVCIRVAMLIQKEALYSEWNIWSLWIETGGAVKTRGQHIHTLTGLVMPKRSRLLNRENTGCNLETGLSSAREKNYNMLSSLVHHSLLPPAFLFLFHFIFKLLQKCVVSVCYSFPVGGS